MRSIERYWQTNASSARKTASGDAAKATTPG
jgi:hypothetical protein